MVVEILFSTSFEKEVLVTEPIPYLESALLLTHTFNAISQITVFILQDDLQYLYFYPLSFAKTLYYLFNFLHCLLTFLLYLL